MKVLNLDQIREADLFTIKNEPIASIDLMERASKKFAEKYIDNFGVNNPVLVFCGNGNNGGDGLAIARLLLSQNVNIIAAISNDLKRSEDCKINLARLEKLKAAAIINYEDAFRFIRNNTVIVDAIFGTGLSRKPEGEYRELIERINALDNIKVAVDIPSGLFTDKPTDFALHADYTFTFHSPKFSFFFPSTGQFAGKLEVLDIGLSLDYINSVSTSINFIDGQSAAALIPRRKKFDHKGNFGHSYLIAGSRGKAGAALMAAIAALRSGCGLLTIHAPYALNTILQSRVPEAMVEDDADANKITKIHPTVTYTAAGIGPGIGTDDQTSAAVLEFLKNNQHTKLVLDADALNILSKAENGLKLLPPETILTPHVKEFERLFGKANDDYERFNLQKEVSQKYKLIIVLKGAHTCITDSNGNAYFNSTGTPAMAKGGSGDVLLGMILGNLAQNRSPLEAAILSVYLHGKAAEIAAEEGNENTVLATDLVNYLPITYQNTTKNHINEKKH